MLTCSGLANITWNCNFVWAVKPMSVVPLNIDMTIWDSEVDVNILKVQRNILVNGCSGWVGEVAKWYEMYGLQALNEKYIILIFIVRGYLRPSIYSKPAYELMHIDLPIWLMRQLKAKSLYGYHKPIPICTTLYAIQHIPYSVCPTQVDFQSIYAKLNTNISFCSIFHMDTISPCPYALQCMAYSVCPTVFSLQRLTIIVYMQLCSKPQVHRWVDCITKQCTSCPSWRARTWPSQLGQDVDLFTKLISSHSGLNIHKYHISVESILMDEFFQYYAGYSGIE